MLTSNAMLNIDDGLKEIVDKTAIDEDAVIQNVVDNISSKQSVERN